MSAFPVVLLPGLHGTAGLFHQFLELAPPHLRPVVVPLPELGAYAELVPALCARMPEGKFAIVGESFSGPLALALARELPERVTAVIVSNSFVAPPRTPLLRLLPWALLLRIPAPSLAIRFLAAGWSASPELVRAVRAAIRVQPPDVLAARMRAILALPPASALPFLQTPLLVLTGTEDRLVPPQTAAPLTRLAAQTTQVFLPAPHLLLQTVPGEAWQAISGFLELMSPRG